MEMPHPLLASSPVVDKGALVMLSQERVWAAGAEAAEILTDQVGRR